MSNRQSQLIGVTFKPVPEPTVRVPDEWILIFGVICPAFVIGIELISHICADAFFDPMPTYWHVAAVSLVPASNLLVWRHLQDETGRPTKWFVFANGMAIAIAGFYALLLLPLLPRALVGIIVGLGLPPPAPGSIRDGGRGRSQRLRRKHARSTIPCTACRSTPGRRRSRRASRPVSPTSSSTTITAAPRSADG